jgi:D-arginine dehydrogenase
MSRAPRILIVGGGIAGLSSAYHLARAGARVELFEAEPALGQRSSGLNAAIWRTAIEEPEVADLAREARAHLLEPPADLGEPSLVDPVGVLLVAEDERGADQLRAQAARSASPHEAIDPETARAKVPHVRLEPHLALWFPEEGRLNLPALIAGFARGARNHGARLHTGRRVRRVLTGACGAEGLELQDGTRLEADGVLIAAGGWGEQLGRDAGSLERLRPTRRHLGCTLERGGVDPRGPVLWTVGQTAFYLCPQEEGLLACVCDQVDVAPDEGYRSDPEQARALEQALAQRWAGPAPVPALGRTWSAVRTFWEPDRFLLGADARVPSLFWAAGLAGHGMTTCFAVGARVRDAVLEQLCGSPNSPLS